jgi:integrase
VPIDPKAPYHDLLLADVVKDPYWLERFEQWMHERTLKPQTRNHYRGLCDQMFRLAIDPRFRQRTGVLINPFAGQPRDRVRSRKVTLAPDDVRQLLTHASYHVRLACAIGALAPTLRMASVLGLRWDRHLDRDLTIITVADHKTAARTGRAQVVPISAQLRAILEDARVRRPKRSPWVITYRRRPVKSIRGGVRNAAIAAGLPYGRDTRDGLTFHTLRHTASSLLRKVGVDPFLQRDFMGHEHLATTALYTHVSPEELAPAAEQLSAALPISDLVTLPRRRARRDGGQNGGESLPQSVKLPAVTSGLRRP